MALKETFTRKIGPLPMWGWVAVVGGAVVLWALYQRQKTNSAQNASAANVTPPVIDQFQLTTPPTQEDEDDTGKIIRTPGRPDDDDKDPTHHHRRHHPRKHPDDDDHHEREDHDRDDRRRRRRTHRPVPRSGRKERV